MHVVVQMIGITMEWGGLRDYWVKKRVKTWPDVPWLSSDNSKRELKATHIGRWVEYIESTWAVYSVDIHPLYSVDRTIWKLLVLLLYWTIARLVLNLSVIYVLTFNWRYFRRCKVSQYLEFLSIRPVHAIVLYRALARTALNLSAPEPCNIGRWPYQFGIFLYLSAIQVQVLSLPV